MFDSQMSSQEIRLKPAMSYFSPNKNMCVVIVIDSEIYTKNGILFTRT
jgi:hypothetical protein